MTNSIIVTTYPRVWTEVEGIIKKLDRMPRQVLIEVLAAEVTLDDSTRLGHAVGHPARALRRTASPTRRELDLPPRPPDLIPPFGTALGPSAGFNFFAFAAGEFLAAINALATDNKVNVLSSPSIMTAENKKAVINVSRSVPILTSQQVPIGGTPTGAGNNQAIVGTQTVEYKDAGIILTVTPRIGEQGTVALDVKQEVNDVGDHDAADELPRVHEARGRDLRRAPEQPDARPRRAHPEPAERRQERHPVPVQDSGVRLSLRKHDRSGSRRRS